MAPTLAEVIAFLDRERIRATYGAVAGMLGVTPHSIERLGHRSTRVSWIVNAATHQPVGFRPDELAPDLATNPIVIRTTGELRRRIAATGVERRAETQRTCRRRQTMRLLARLRVGRMRPAHDGVPELVHDEVHC